MSDPFDPLNPPLVPTPTGAPASNDPNANLIGGAASSQAVTPTQAGLPPQMMEILALLGQIMQYRQGAGQLKGIFGGGSYGAPSAPVPIGTNGPAVQTPAPAAAPTPGAGPQGIVAGPAPGLQGIFGGGVATPDVGTGGGFQEALARRRRFGG